MRKNRAICVASLALFSCRANAIVNEKKRLDLHMVREMVMQTFPLVLAAEKKIERAKGELQVATGAFDLKWKLDSKSVVDGPYENQFVETIVEKPVIYRGLSLYAGYRRGRGEFPAYDGEYETSLEGEALAGVRIPLWRGGLIDANRADLAKSKIAIKIAESERLLKLLDALEKASHLYWAWVAAGLKVNVYERLLEQAKVRERGLKKRVQLGDLPEIELVDNERAILKRKSQVIKAIRDFERAQYSLSIFLNSHSKSDQALDKERLPAHIGLPREVALPKDIQKIAARKRPEIEALRLAQSQRQIEVELARNDRQPQIDLQLETKHGLGGRDLDVNQAHIEAVLIVDIPLQTNKADGKRLSAQAEKKMFEFETHYLQRQIKAEVQNLLSALDAESRKVSLAEKELELARKLEQGERTRFKEGASNQLFVNIREQATADAEVRRLESLEEYHKTLASLYSAFAEIRME